MATSARLAMRAAPKVAVTPAISAPGAAARATSVTVRVTASVVLPFAISSFTLSSRRSDPATDAARRRRHPVIFRSDPGARLVKRLPTFALEIAVVEFLHMGEHRPPHRPAAVLLGGTRTIEGFGNLVQHGRSEERRV